MMSKNDRLSYWPFLLVSILVILMALPALAESTGGGASVAGDAGVAAATDSSGEGDGDLDSTTSGQDTGSSQAPSGLLSKLSVHGFLTQAYATANFVDVPIGVLPDGTTGPLGPSPSITEISLGIPEDATTNYRFLALQFRYDISAKDIVVVQFSSRTLGFSPLQDFEDEIELDWAFYERRLGDYSSLKVGRIQIPIGIYNEVRDVGTVLPFYRPAFVFYKEGSFTSETVDGLSLAHTFFPQSNWSLDATAYAGEFESIQLFTPVLAGIVRAKDAYGYQLWLNTPYSDLRIGTGLLSFNTEGGPLETLDRRNIFHASLDATFGRFTLQGEWDQETETGLRIPVGVLLVRPSEWYVLAGVEITEALRFYAQMESAEIRFDSTIFVAPLNRTQREDIGVALNYFFSPSLVLKAEYHWVEEVGANNYFQSFSPMTGPVFRQVPFTASNGTYSIIALSVSF